MADEPLVVDGLLVLPEVPEVLEVPVDGLLVVPEPVLDFPVAEVPTLLPEVLFLPVLLPVVPGVLADGLLVVLEPVLDLPVAEVPVVPEVPVDGLFVAEVPVVPLAVVDGLFVVPEVPVADVPVVPVLPDAADPVAVCVCAALGLLLEPFVWEQPTKGMRPMPKARLTASTALTTLLFKSVVVSFMLCCPFKACSYAVLHPMVYMLLGVSYNRRVIVLNDS